MSDSLRELLYPLGFLSAIAFSARMLLQWVTSEARKESVVMPIFWKLSLTGNVLLAVHGFIQAQFHVCAIQVCNAVISWRNLNLMQPFSKQISTKTTIYIMVCALTSIAAGFLLQDFEWFRTPTFSWYDIPQTPLSMMWHLFGFFGLALFSSRFWIQWWSAERRQTSYLGPTFWWFSLVGESICLVYFWKIHDPVNFIGPAFALIPYIRNLILLKRKPSKEPL